MILILTLSVKLMSLYDFLFVCSIEYILIQISFQPNERLYYYI